MLRSLLLLFCLCGVACCVAQIPQLLLQTGHRSEIFDVAVSEDGKWMVTAGRDKQVILWNFATGRQIRSFRGHEGYVNAVAISPDNLEIASASDDGTVRTWHLVSGEMKQVSAVQDERLRSIAYNRKGDELVSSSLKNIQLWHAGDLLLKRRIGRSIGSNAEFIGGKDLLVADRYENASNYISILSTSTGSVISDFERLPFIVKNFHGSNDGKYLALESNFNQITLWDLEKKKQIWLSKENEYDQGRTSLHFSPGNRYLSYTSSDHVQIYETKTGKLILSEPIEEAYTTAFSADENYFITGTRAQGLLIMDVSGGKLQRKISGAGAYVVSASFNHDGSSVYIASRPDYKIWDLTTNQVKSIADGKMTNVAITESKSGRYLAYNQSDSTFIFDTKTRKQISSFQPDQNSFMGFVLAFTPEEDYLITSSAQLEFWNVRSGEMASFSQSNGVTTAISNDGKWLVKGTDGNTKRMDVWDFPARKRIFAMNGMSPIDIKFSPDSKWFGATDLNGVVGIWNPKTGQQEKLFVASGIIGSIAFNPSGTYLAGAGEDNTITIWETLNWSVVAVLKGHNAAARSVEFSPDGKTLLSTSDDATIRLWDVAGWKIKSILFPTDKNNFIIFNDQNNYTTTKGALQKVAFNMNNNIYPFEQFDVRLNRPDLVLASQGTATTETIKLYQTAYEKRIKRMNITPGNIQADYNVPVLKFNGKTPFTTTSKIFQCSLTATDASRDLERLNVLVNDVPMYGKNGLSLMDQPKRTLKKDISIELTQGKNKIQLSVMNDKSAESLYETFYINYTGPETKPDLYILAIGVSDYDDNNYDLNYASKDAADVIALFSEKKSSFNKIIVMKYLDKDAVKEKILEAKSTLNKSKAEDVVVAFVAGHGLLDDKLDYYIATADIDFSKPALRGLNYDDLEGLLDGIPARKKLLLIDACHSGEIDKDNVKKTLEEDTYPTGVTTRGLTFTLKQKVPMKSYDAMQVLFADLRKSTGAVVISSASGLEFAFESASFRNGVFTYALLQGLRSYFADLNGDKKVVISELQEYILRKVSELTNGVQHPTSRKENLEFDFDVW